MKALLMPTLDCNLKCEYCYLQGSKTKELVKSFRDYHKANEWISGLKWFEKEFGDIDSVDISGGEPFLYDDMIPLIKLVLTKYGRINITSNLELLPEDFFKLDPFNIGITVSLHLDEHAHVRKKFLEMMSRLKAKGFRFTINFVGHPNQIDRFEMIVNLSNTFGVGVHLEPYVDYNTEKMKFSIETNHYYTESDIAGIEYSKKRKYPSDCNIVGKYAVFLPNGDVYPCFGMMFKGDLKMANIFDRVVYEKPKNPLKCNVFCPCAQNYRDGFR